MLKPGWEAIDIKCPNCHKPMGIRGELHDSVTVGVEIDCEECGNTYRVVELPENKDKVPRLVLTYNFANDAENEGDEEDGELVN